MRELHDHLRSRRYILLQRLGRGGTADTWRARREGGVIEDDVCLKLPRFALSAEEQRTLVEEARLLSRVRHVHVVSLLDVVRVDDDRLALVLEWVRGADLRVVSACSRAEGGLSAPAVAWVGVALCRALAAAQRAIAGGLVHRDISPHNVLVSHEGELKLADFGIARAFDRQSWTAPRRLKGKLAYASPEQLRGECLDVRSDLFAVGCVLWEIASGRHPFAEDCRERLMSAVLSGACPLSSGALAQAPDLECALRSLLHADREQRPANADVAAELLSSIASESNAVRELRRMLRGGRPGLARCGAQAPAGGVIEHSAAQ